MPILSQHTVEAMLHDNLDELDRPVRARLFDALKTDTPRQLADVLNSGTLDGFAFVRTPQDYAKHRQDYVRRATYRHAVTYGPVERLLDTGYSITPLYGEDGNALFLVHINYVDTTAPVEMTFAHGILA